LEKAPQTFVLCISGLALREKLLPLLALLLLDLARETGDCVGDLDRLDTGDLVLERERVMEREFLE